MKVPSRATTSRLDPVARPACGCGKLLVRGSALADVNIDWRLPDDEVQLFFSQTESEQLVKKDRKGRRKTVLHRRTDDEGDVGS